MTREEIGRWLDELYTPGGTYTDKNKKYTHLVVMQDWFDYEYYPVFVTEEDDVHKVANTQPGNDNDRVIEVYSVNHDRDEQLNAQRVFNYD